MKESYTPTEEEMKKAEGFIEEDARRILSLKRERASKNLKKLDATGNLSFREVEEQNDKVIIIDGDVNGHKIMIKLSSKEQVIQSTLDGKPMKDEDAAKFFNKYVNDSTVTFRQEEDDSMYNQALRDLGIND